MTLEPEAGARTPRPVPLRGPEPSPPGDTRLPTPTPGGTALRPGTIVEPALLARPAGCR